MSVLTVKIHDPKAFILPTVEDYAKVLKENEGLYDPVKIAFKCHGNTKGLYPKKSSYKKRS